jgi:hypothetical protein
MPELTEWETFYVIVGAAAGALVGLQFVVMTLLAERPPPRAAEAGAAFATPTIVHFSVVLFLSAAMTAPWRGIAPLAVVCAISGLAGVLYILIVAGRMRGQTIYRPAAEDWWFHVVLPLLAYALLAVSAFTARARPRESLFGAGAVTLLLLLAGIHNAWDAVVYHVFVNRRGARPDDR